jgi:hypothetical protein
MVWSANSLLGNRTGPLSHHILPRPLAPQGNIDQMTGTSPPQRDLFGQSHNHGHEDALQDQRHRLGADDRERH